MKTIDMNTLQDFNPKLHAQLQSDPQRILDLKDLILANEAKGDMASNSADAAATAAEAM